MPDLPVPAQRAGQDQAPAAGSTYGGDVQGWTLDGGGKIASIKVDGWAVEGSRYTPGTVPSATYDTVYSSHTTPTVWIGTTTKVFDQNWVCTIDHSVTASPVGSAGYLNNPVGQVNSQVHACEGVEIDLNNGARENVYQNLFHGITIEYSGRVAPTADSYDMYLGGNMPTLLQISEFPTATAIRTNAFLLKGNAGVSSASAGALGEMEEVEGYANGSVPMRIVQYLRQVPASHGSGVEARIGLVTAGPLGDLSSKTMNNLQAALVFEPTGAGGSVGLFGYGGTGLTINGAGAGSFGSSVSASGYGVSAGGSIAWTPSSGSGNGTPFISAASSTALNVSTSSGKASQVIVKSGSTVCWGTAGTLCIENDGKSFFFLSGSTRLASINNVTGNAIFKGTVTARGSP